MPCVYIPKNTELAANTAVVANIIMITYACHINTFDIMSAIQGHTRL